MKFVGVFPNFRSKKSNIQTYCDEFKFPFETRTDYFKTLTHKFGVTITPEVVVYNENKQEILYRGRIDNAYVSLGKRRQVITKHELRDALQVFKAGDLEPLSFTDAIGCFIEKSTPLKEEAHD